MGGFGPRFLGGRLPGFFGSVATLSGFDDIQYAGLTSVMGPTASAVQHGDNDPDPVVGPPAGFYPTGHNPAPLAVNLAHTRVVQNTGTGNPASHEPGQLPAPALAGDLLSEKQI